MTDSSHIRGAARKVKRVLLVSHLYPTNDSSSYGIFVREQAEALARHFDVHVLVGRYGLRESRTLRDDARDLTIHEVALPAYGTLPSSLTVLRALTPYARAASSLIEELRPHIVHAHFGVPDGVVATQAAASRVPVVVTLHGSDFHRQLTRPLFGRMIARRLAMADLLIGVSPAITEGIQSSCNIPADRVQFLVNGYNSGEIRSHPHREPKYFLFAGGLIERKNPDVLLEAYASIAQRVPHGLVMVGDGPMRPALEQRVLALGLTDRVQVLGQRAHGELDGLLADAVAMVLPSRSEGLPIVVNEALASGTPVIASRLPGTEVQVSRPEFGLLVPAGDVQALSEALVTAAGTEWDYSLIARECGIPSWAEYAQGLAVLYEKLADA